MTTACAHPTTSIPESSPSIARARRATRRSENTVCFGSTASGEAERDVIVKGGARRVTFRDGNRFTRTTGATRLSRLVSAVVRRRRRVAPSLISFFPTTSDLKKLTSATRVSSVSGPASLTSHGSTENANAGSSVSARILPMINAPIGVLAAGDRQRGRQKVDLGSRNLVRCQAGVCATPDTARWCAGPPGIATSAV